MATDDSKMLQESNKDLTTESVQEDCVDRGTVGTAQTEQKVKTDNDLSGKHRNNEISTNNDDDDLEEGELKDDDDDDDDDDLDGSKKDSKQQSGASDSEDEKQSTKSSSSSSNNSSNVTGKSNHEEDIKVSKEPPSPKSSSSEEVEKTPNQPSYSSRHGSSSRQSPHSHHSHRSRRRSSPFSSQQARLVKMRARLLEARSREIEMKFQKTKSITSSPPLSSISSGQTRNLKTTLAKPPITYCENPNPVSPDDTPPIAVSSSAGSKRKSKKQKSSKSSSKKSRKRKKKKEKESPKKHKKSKSSDTPKKTIATDVKANVNLPVESVSDRQGPRTPPDNHVLTLDDEQIEWPSYLIKMTTTQPPISYSVNPHSVADKTVNTTDKSDTADLNSDYTWFLNYFINIYDMDRSQAQHQASSAIISSGNYDTEVLNKWLEQRGLLRHTVDEENDVYPIPHCDDQQEQQNSENHSASANVIIRSTKPRITTLKLQREITLPNGQVLPAGTIQKIVHPYPRPERSRALPELLSGYSDLF